MMKHSVIGLLALCVAVYGYDREAMSKRPGSQPNFMLDKWMGEWYIQARLVSCSWSGSKGFMDFTQVLNQDQKSVIATESWRVGDDCAKTIARLTQNQPNVGCFTAKDTFGDVWTGDTVVPATDYKSFSITWGCTKKVAGGSHKCADAWISVKTRRRHPSPHTWKVVEAILKKLWNLPLSEMNRVTHDNPC